MDHETLSAQHRIADRKIVDELPRRVALLPGEVELVAQHLLDALNALLAGRPSPSTDPP